MLTQLSGGGAVLVGGLLFASAGALTAQQAGAAAVSHGPTPADLPGEPYSETIPGTLVGFDMIPIPAGEVEVATATGPVRQSVGPFWMGRIEIPWDVYDVFVFRLDERAQSDDTAAADAQSRPSRPYLLPGANFGHQGRPALAMSHHGASRFAEWLAERTGRKYRLPTEAEWEYACRANQPEPVQELAEYAWYWENANDRTQPGANREPNAFGLYDMLGNVAEWVDGVDGEPVVKGGAFLDDAEDVHCGARKQQTAAWNATDPQLPKSRWWLSDAPFVGFRLVREP